MILFLVVLNLVFIACLAAIYLKYESWKIQTRQKIEKELQDKLAGEFAKAQALKSKASVEITEAELTKKEAAEAVKSMSEYVDYMKIKKTRAMAYNERKKRREAKDS